MPAKSSSRLPLTAVDVQSFLDSAGATRRIVSYRSGARIFVQGGVSDAVMYLQRGRVKLSVLSGAGKEAVVAMFTPGDFFGEGVLAGQPLRIASATAMVASTVLVIEKATMARLLHEQHEFSDRFIRYMLVRNIRVEADLVDHLFNSSERRLARTLLLLARYGELDNPDNVLPKISQETLAEMIGTTRSRVNFFMNKFKKLGFIDYDGGGIRVRRSLLTVVLHDQGVPRVAASLRAT
jgi:CRP/FNR family cyclic AMP-dependent transcriptional regulator